jgi:putative hydrolase of the HAD superfamily
MTKLPPAILLDLDDTILDDTGGVSSCWLDACVAHRAAMGDLDPRSVYDAIERIRDWYWSDADRHRVGRLDLAAARREVVRLSLADIGVDAPGLAEKIGDTYHALRDAAIRPFEDAIATVQWLRESGCRLALLTNGSGDAQRSKIARFGLESLFDAILIEGELGFGKPDPRVYVRALEALEVSPADTWMVGDNLEWDVAQPQRHGILGIWIDVRGRGLPAGYSTKPDRVVRRLSQLRSDLG